MSTKRGLAKGTNTYIYDYQIARYAAHESQYTMTVSISHLTPIHWLYTNLDEEVTSCLSISCNGIRVATSSILRAVTPCPKHLRYIIITFTKIGNSFGWSTMCYLPDPHITLELTSSCSPSYLTSTMSLWPSIPNPHVQDIIRYPGLLLNNIMGEVHSTIKSSILLSNNDTRSLQKKNHSPLSAWCMTISIQWSD